MCLVAATNRRSVPFDVTRENCASAAQCAQLDLARFDLDLKLEEGAFANETRVADVRFPDSRKLGPRIVVGRRGRRGGFRVDRG
jgi:hypothetical protein